MRARDPELLTELVRELSPRIRVAIRTFADSDEEVDDLLQACWVRILDRLDRYEPSGSFAGWATKVSKNVCLTNLRDRKRAGVVEVDFHEEIWSNLDDDGAPAGRESEQLRWEQLVHEALARLPDREREVIVLRLLEGKTTAEAAQILKVSEAGVRGILHRGMTRLKRMEELRGLLAEWMGWD